MNHRTLLILVLALGAAGLLAWNVSRPRDVGAEWKTGQALLKEFDPNALGRVQVAGGTQSVVLARGPTGWTVENLWNYPADFDRLRNLLRDLGGLKIGDVMRGGHENLGEFGLATTIANAAAQVPVEVRLQDTTGREIAYLVLGQPRTSGAEAGFSGTDSQYVRLNDGPVLLVAPDLDPVPPRAEDWLERVILDLPPDRITAMKASLKDGVRYGIRRDQGQLTGEENLAGKNINPSSADLWFQTWKGVTAQTVLDPSRNRADWGLDSGDLVEAHTQDGLHVKVQLGQANEQGERPAVFTINWTAPVLPDQLEGEARTEAEKVQQATGEKAVALQKKVAPWVYQLTASAARQFTMLQEQLIAAEVTTNASPGNATPPP